MGRVGDGHGIDRTMKMDLKADRDLRKSYIIPVDLHDLLRRLLARRILVEAPLGMRDLALDVAKDVGGDVSGRNAWGACDIGYGEALALGYDTVVHLAHELSPNVLNHLRHNLNCEIERGEDYTIITIGGVRVVVVPVYYRPVEELINRLIPKIGRFDGIVGYSLPYKLYAEAISRKLGAKLSTSAITGCYMGMSADEVLMVSSGYFHALTVKLFSPTSRVLLADPFRGTVEDVEAVFRRYLALKLDALSRAIGARRVVALVTTKAGQRPPGVIDKLKEMGLTVVVADEISPDVIENLNVDAVINTACPRVGFDDLDRVSKPVVNIGEYEIVRLGRLASYEPTLTVRWIASLLRPKKS